MRVMMHLATMPRLPIAVLALASGIAIQTGGICVVRAAAETASGRFGQLLCTFLAAATAAVTLALARSIDIADAVPQLWPSFAGIAGAVVFAAGARLNGACAIGTVGRLAEGDLAYLATLLGAGLAAAAYGGPRLQAMTPGLNLTWQEVWAGCLVVLTVFGLLALRRYGRLTHWRSYVLVGSTGALLAASQAHWAWIDVVRDLVRGNMLSSMGLVAFGALFAGAIGAAFWMRRWRLRRPSLRHVLRDFAGGALMMTGGVMTPGGNDSLVLYGLPGGSPRAVMAWLVMFLALYAGFVIEKARASAASRARPSGARVIINT
jgi:uncharacterized membrane protein YedE/YeeE